MPARTLTIGEEYPPEGEAQRIERVVNASLELLRSTPTKPTGGPVPRGQHPKSHGCVRAEFTVGADVPPELRHGVFREPRTYTALVRFSNGLNADDRKGDLHGMAIKLLGVEGEKVLESEKEAPTQDFVLVDQPIFFIRDVADYVPFSEQVLRLSRGPFWWRPIVVVFRAFMLGDCRWRLVMGMRTKPADVLGQRYWSQTPYKLDRLAVKYSVRPVPYPFPCAAPRDSKNRLRESLASHLAGQEAWFDFLVHVQTDPKAMPVEDPTVVWDEAKSPPTKVATLRIPVQQFDTAAVREFDENLSFTPWHAL
ncbi:MAG: catalase family protein, partial [Planctomycetaceae bacterium]|nr:catalase family protein [Planctomycetaceae bacterium]